MRQLIFLPAILFLFAVPTEAASQENVFDLKTLLAPPLQAKTLRTSEKDGIITEEVRFHSHTDGEKSIDIFAFFSYPKLRKATRLPAFIWNQGGLGQASTYWTEFGAKRGYATLCIDFPLPGYRSTGGYPINSGLVLGDNPRQAPIYHGAVALLRAVSYLESRPEVDKERIGMAGSSWGGFFTTLMAGIDPRLKAASSMFGCGALELGNLWWHGSGNNPLTRPGFREHWRKSLDPATRLEKSKTPIAWFTGTNDQFYYLPAVLESKKLAAGPSHLAVLPNWQHALNVKLEEQVFAWLDIHLKKGNPFLGVLPLEIRRADKKLQARWRVTGTGQIERVELLLSHGPESNWLHRYWRTLPARLESDVAVIELPGGTMPYLVIGQVIDNHGFITSTNMVQVEPGKLGFKEGPVPDQDGCSLWGGFEKEQVEVIQRHGWGAVTVADDAKSGRHSFQLKTGRWKSPPILGTPSLKQRLTLHLKASEPGKVKVGWHTLYPRQPRTLEQQVQVGPNWVAVHFEDTLPEELGSMHLLLDVPAGLTVLVDEVSLRPVGGKP